MEQNGLKGKAFSNFAWKFSEQILAQAVNLIVSIVLARLLLPEDYGVVTVILIFIAFCDVFITQGFSSALIQKKDADDLDFSSMFHASLAISVVLYLILFFSAPYIQGFFGSDYDSLSPILRVMGLQIPISSLKSIQQAYVSRELLFKKFFFATMSGKVVSAFVGILMALKGFGAWSLAGQSLSAIVVDTLVLYSIVKWRPKMHFSFDRVLPMMKYSYKLVLAGLVDTAYNKLRSFVIGIKYTPDQLAYYDKGDQFPSVLGNTTNSSLMAVLFPVMSKFQEDKQSVLTICRRSVKICTYVIFPLMAGLIVITPELITLLLTDKWASCVPYMRVFCLVYAFHPIYTVNLQAIKAIGRSGAFLLIEVLKKVAGILCLIFAIPYGVYWIAISLLVATFLNYIINGIGAKVYLSYGYWNQIVDIIPNAFLAVIMAVVVFIIPPFTDSILTMLVVKLIAGIAMYGMLSILFKNESFVYLKDLLTTNFVIFHGKDKRQL